MANEPGGGTPQNQSGAEGAGVTPPTTGAGNSEPTTFEGWYGSQEDTVKSLVDGHISGLKNALNGERDRVKELSKQLKELSKGAEEGSALKEQLDSLSARLEEYEVQNAAYETFARAGVLDFRAAWLVAQDLGAIDKRGNVNLEMLRTEKPYLFAKPPAPRGDAGAGTSNGAPPTRSMNDFIRKASGRN